MAKQHNRFRDINPDLGSCTRFSQAVFSMVCGSPLKSSRAAALILRVYGLTKLFAPPTESLENNSVHLLMACTCKSPKKALKLLLKMMPPGHIHLKNIFLGLLLILSSILFGDRGQGFQSLLCEDPQISPPQKKEKGFKRTLWCPECCRNVLRMLFFRLCEVSLARSWSFTAEDKKLLDWAIKIPFPFTLFSQKRCSG